MTTQTPQAPRPAWREAPYRRLLIGQGTSLLGDQVWLVVLAWLATGRVAPGLAGLVIAAPSIPRALLFLWAGATVDRRAPERVAVVCDVLRAAVFVIAAGLAWTAGAAQLTVLLAAVGLTVGIADAFFFPATAALRPRLLAEEQLAGGTSAYEIVSRTAMIAGPVLGGVLVGFSAVWLACAANAATFLVSAVCLAGLRPRSAPHATAPHRRTLGMVREGLAYLWSHHQLRALVAVLTAFNLAIAGALNMGGILVARHRGMGPTGAAALFTGFAAGAIAGALTLTLRRPKDRDDPMRWIGGAGLLQAIGIACIAFSGDAVQLAGASLLSGASSAIIGVLASTLVQQATDDRFRGRVNSVTGLVNYGVPPLALGLTGVLADWRGPTAALLVLAAAEAVAAATCLRREHRRHVRDRTDPAPRASH